MDSDLCCWASSLFSAGCRCIYIYNQQVPRIYFHPAVEPTLPRRSAGLYQAGGRWCSLAVVWFVERMIMGNCIAVRNDGSWFVLSIAILCTAIKASE